MTAKRSSRSATDAQINYLCVLAQKVELIRRKDPDLTKYPEYIDWQTERHKGVTVDDASLRIEAYRTILRNIQLLCMLLGKPKYRFYWKK